MVEERPGPGFNSIFIFLCYFQIFTLEIDLLYMLVNVIFQGEEIICLTIELVSIEEWVIVRYDFISILKHLHEQGL